MAGMPHVVRPDPAPAQAHRPWGPESIPATLGLPPDAVPLQCISGLLLSAALSAWWWPERSER